MPRRLICALVVGSSVLAAGCGVRPAGRTESSREVVGRLAAALRGEDPRALWELEAAAARGAESYDAFAARFRATRAERERRAAALERVVAEGEQLGERGRLTAPGGPAVELVREADGWHLERALAAPAQAQTPGEALRLFVSAVEERSVPGILRLLTSARRDDVRKALDQLATGLRGHLDDALDVSGDRATLSWHDGERRYRVTLRRENGEWRIDDVLVQ